MANKQEVIEGVVRRVDRPDAAVDDALGPAGDEVAPKSLYRPMLVGLTVLLLGFGGFLVWASTAPLDEGVPSAGVVVVESKRKTVQHQSGGIVSELKVREGDVVKAGQVLLVLDPATARANREAADAQYVLSRATEARLLAERTGTARLSFPTDLLDRAKDPAVAAMFETQRQLFASRRQSLASEQASFREAVAGLEAQLKGIEEIERERQNQIALYEREVAALAPMVEEGLFPRNRHQELRRQLSTAYAARQEGLASAARVRTQIAETRARALVREQEYRKEVDTQLAEASQNSRAAAEKLNAVSLDLQRTEVRAPVDGAVVGLQIHTVGGVIGAGSKLMDIVPVGDTFIVEAQVPPMLIRHVHIGQAAQLRFSALDQRMTPVVEGKLITVSADIVTDERGNSYFVARIEVPTKALADLGYTQVQPGMPVEAIIVTGERSLFAYLFKPLADRFARGMKEH